MLATKSVEYVEMMSLLAWKIWLARNKWCMEKKRFDTSKVLEEAQMMRTEMYKNTNPSRSERRTTNSTKWVPPPSGTLKLNSDVAIFNDGTVGFGFAIRDSTGDVLLAGTRREQKEGNITTMEGLAVLFAIRSALEAGFVEFQIESDSKCLIDSIQGKGGAECSNEVIVGDVIHLAKVANCKGFFHVHREGNKLAHMLAHFPLDIDASLFWFEELPYSMEEVRKNDLYLSSNLN
ncbi:hypothetical protein DH2020_049820 [Rehmannia glutinosa]|uniref:RNase H type-1 domain-containing protein n=1 Tax=Rehmannia glutinosa TaxID=99300 RepID=A0ABR0U1J7_REHGL